MPIDLPNRERLLTTIVQILESHWSKDLLTKRGTYQSAETGLDLIPGAPPNISVKGIRSFLCIYDEDSTYNKTSSTEDRRPLNDCVTDFVTTHFFEHSEDRIRFILLVSVVYERFFATVCAEISKTDKRRLPTDALLLMFKGGMSLRMNLLEMARNLSSAAEGDIALFLRDELKMSDFDFEIISNPTYITPDDVCRINILSYIVIQHLRSYLLEYSDTYFTFFRYSSAYKKQILDKLRTAMQSKLTQQPRSSPYAGARVDAIAISPVGCNKGSTIFSSLNQRFDPTHYSMRTPRMDTRHPAYRADFAIIPCASLTTQRTPTDPKICFTSSRDLLRAYGIRQGRHPRSPLYATHNPYISFTAGTSGTLLEHVPSGMCNLHQQDNKSKDRIAFQLNRIRYTCVVYLLHEDDQKTQEYITGELLDVSHAIATDSKRSCAVCRTEKPWSYATSSIRFYPNVRFSILNPHEQYRDHYFMLFKQAEFPWLVPKYEKRLRRLVAIMVMFLFSSLARQQYTEWSLLSFVDRITALGSIVTWFDHLRAGSVLSTETLRGIPLAYDLAVSVSELYSRPTIVRRPEMLEMIQNMHTVLMFLSTIFIRERFYMADRTLSHTPHDPGTLFDHVIS